MSNIIPYNETKVINVEMDNKPMLAAKSEYMKIKDYQVEQRNTLTFELTLHLLSLMNVQVSIDDEKTESHKKMVIWINESMGKFTYQEIIHAFNMAIAGEFKPLELIPGYLNAVIVGRVMSAYQSKKNVELTAYNQLKQKQMYKPEELTEDQKALNVLHGCITCFDSYVQKGYIIDGYSWVHDHLMDLKLLDFSKEEKGIMWGKSKLNLKNEYKSLKYGSKEERIKAREILKELENKGTNKREIEYKKIRLERYFDTLIAKGEHLKDKL